MARAHLKPLAEAAPPPAKPSPAKPTAAAAPPAAANSSAPPKAHTATGLPPITTEDPWRHLHPSRVWPD